MTGDGDVTTCADDVPFRDGKVMARTGNVGWDNGQDSQDSQDVFSNCLATVWKFFEALGFFILPSGSCQ